MAKFKEAEEAFKLKALLNEQVVKIGIALDEFQRGEISTPKFNEKITDVKDALSQIDLDK